MHLIEPCCAQKHLSELRGKLRKSGTVEFEGYGDLSLTELLPPLVTHYNGVELLIAAPSLPDQAADAVKSCMRKEWARIDGSGKIPVITHLTIVTDLRRKKSPVASQWLRDNPFGGRLSLVDRRQDDTAILMPDLAITGPVNMRYGEHFVATATTEAGRVAALWEQYTRPAVEPAGTAEEEDGEAALAPQHAGQEPEAAPGQDDAYAMS